AQIDERFGIKSMGGETPLLALRVRRAEGAEMHAAITRHVLAHAPGVGRIERGREDLDVSFLEHDAAVRGAGVRALRAVRRLGRHDEAHRLGDTRRRAEIRNEMRYVVEIELARRGLLLFGDGHGANIAPTRTPERTAEM